MLHFHLRTLIGPLIFRWAEHNPFGMFSKWICDISHRNLRNPAPLQDWVNIPPTKHWAIVHLKKVLHYNQIFSTVDSANFPFIRPINISHTGFQTALACQFSLQATLQAALRNTTGLPCVWASFSCGSSCQAEFMIICITDSHAGSRKPLMKTVLLLSTGAVCGSFAVSQRAVAKRKQFPALALSSK